MWSLEEIWKLKASSRTLRNFLCALVKSCVWGDMGETGGGVSAAGSGPRAAVAEGELRFVFVVLMIIQVNDVIFHFWGVKTYVMMWIQLLWKYGLIKECT